MTLTGVFSREAKCLSTCERMTWTDVGLNWRNDHNRGPARAAPNVRMTFFSVARVEANRIRELYAYPALFAVMFRKLVKRLVAEKRSISDTSL